VKSIRHQRVKLLMAAAIASGLVAIGAVAAVAVGQQQTGTVNGSPMTIGETATTTTPPAAPPTAKASPTMKAVPPKGF
jgi:invasion protein IalB